MQCNSLEKYDSVIFQLLVVIVTCELPVYLLRSVSGGISEILVSLQAKEQGKAEAEDLMAKLEKVDHEIN